MANEEHLKILKQGVDVWNKWREENPGIKPEFNHAVLPGADLSGANFRETDFCYADLSGADLSMAILQRTKLFYANLQRADLSESNISVAVLSSANLWNANLTKADLTKSDLTRIMLVEAEMPGAKLQGADISNSDLSGANLAGVNLVASNLEDSNLTGANLFEANLNRAELIRTNFTKANLTSATLRKAVLVGAILVESDLSFAHLWEANLDTSNLSLAILVGASIKSVRLSDSTLNGANLTKADISGTTLNRSSLIDADITGANLYGTARDGWKIEGIKCAYVYFDFDREERIPKDRDFKLGEFEERYKSLPKFEYIFEQGYRAVDGMLMDFVVEEISFENPEYELRLDSLHSRFQPRAVFTVSQQRFIEDAFKKIKVHFETKIKAIEAERDTYEKAFAMALKEPRTYIESVRRLEMIDEKYGDKYESHGPVAAMGRGAKAYNTQQLWNQISHDTDLPMLAEELSKVNSVLKKEAKEPEHYRAIAEITEAETAAKAGKGSKVLEHLKKAGKWSFGVAKDIGTDIAAETLKKAMGL